MAVGGAAGLLRSASGTALGLGQTALGLGQTALGAVTGANAPTSPVHRTQSEVVLGSPRQSRAGAGEDEDEDWEILGAKEWEVSSRVDKDQVAGPSRRQPFPAPRVGRHQVPLSRFERQSFPVARVGRQHVAVQQVAAQQDPELEDDEEEEEEEEGIPQQQRTYRPSHPGLEDDLADAMSGKM